MDLSSFIPKKVDYTFKQGLKVTLKPMSIGDESWMKHTFGEKQLEKSLEALNMDVIARILYHQLDVESKKELIKVKFVDIDEDGKEIEVYEKPVDKIKALVEGPQEVWDILNTILKSKGTSLPELGELLEDEDLKKFLEKKKQTG